MVFAAGSGTTESIKVPLEVRVPSLTVKVMVVLPLIEGVGVTVTVRLAPLPPKTILEAGTSAGLLDEPANVNSLADVWVSETVNPRAPVLVSAGIVCAAMVEIAGGVLSAVVKVA